MWDIAPKNKNALEIDSPQADLHFIANFTKIVISDLSIQLVLNSRNTFRGPSCGRHP